MKIRDYFLATALAATATISLPSFAQSTAAVSPAVSPAVPVAVSATVPVFPGWYNGRPVVYLATEASDKSVAKSFGANYVPQLANAALSVPKSVDDIYAVTNFTQSNIIPSAPQPLGPKNANQSYTPLWQISLVTWVDGVTRHTLRSERAVLDAVGKGEMTLVKTSIVVNCSVIETPSGTLPGVTINYK